jgi:aerobic-type carbon monoxide dehydrogenase small subunit (CoxS/CutS family)
MEKIYLQSIWFLQNREIQKESFFSSFCKRNFSIKQIVMFKRKPSPTRNEHKLEREEKICMYKREVECF